MLSFRCWLQNCHLSLCSLNVAGLKDPGRKFSLWNTASDSVQPCKCIFCQKFEILKWNHRILSCNWGKFCWVLGRRCRRIRCTSAWTRSRTRPRRRSATFSRRSSCRSASRTTIPKRTSVSRAPFGKTLFFSKFFVSWLVRWEIDDGCGLTFF